MPQSAKVQVNSESNSKSQIDSVIKQSEKSQIDTLKGFQEMEDELDQLKKETVDMEKQKEQEAMQLKQKIQKESQLKAKLDETAQFAIQASKLQNKMVYLRDKATENLIQETQSDIKNKVKLAMEVAQRTNQLAQEISDQTDSMQSQIKTI